MHIYIYIYIYILVGYHYGANYIRAIELKNRRELRITKAWEKLYNSFKKVAAAPITYVLDSEKLKDLLESFQIKKIAY